LELAPKERRVMDVNQEEAKLATEDVSASYRPRDWRKGRVWTALATPGAGGCLPADAFPPRELTEWEREVARLIEDSSPLTAVERAQLRDGTASRRTRMSAVSHVRSLMEKLKEISGAAKERVVAMEAAARETAKEAEAFPKEVLAVGDLAGSDRREHDPAAERFSKETLDKAAAAFADEEEQARAEWAEREE
jgi:hypothetical protein